MLPPLLRPPTRPSQPPTSSLYQTKFSSSSFAWLEIKIKPTTLAGIDSGAARGGRGLQRRVYNIDHYRREVFRTLDASSIYPQLGKSLLALASTNKALREVAAPSLPGTRGSVTEIKLQTDLANLLQDLTPNRVSLPASRYITCPARAAFFHHASFRGSVDGSYELFSQLHLYPNLRSLSLDRYAWKQLFGSESTTTEEQSFARTVRMQLAPRITKLELLQFWARDFARTLPPFSAPTPLKVAAHDLAMHRTAWEELSTTIEACGNLQSLCMKVPSSLGFCPIAFPSSIRSLSVTMLWINQAIWRPVEGLAPTLVDLTLKWMEDEMYNDLPEPDNGPPNPKVNFPRLRTLSLDHFPPSRGPQAHRPPL